MVEPAFDTLTTRIFLKCSLQIKSSIDTRWSVHLQFDSLWMSTDRFPSPMLQIMEQAFQTQTTMKTASGRLTTDLRDHTISVRLLNQSLERYVEQLHGWKDVIEETDDRMKSLTQDQYDLKATMQQVNTTVALR